mmetsp:Transcript_1309/g.3055  ORF Transcript_1309/g.3055 Transcript_1309/m.3055 type:complete len:283 (-) Transcript_1309:333-1181(-)
MLSAREHKNAVVRKLRVASDVLSNGLQHVVRPRARVPLRVPDFQINLTAHRKVGHPVGPELVHELQVRLGEPLAGDDDDEVEEPDPHVADVAGERKPRRPRPGEIPELEAHGGGIGVARLLGPDRRERIARWEHRCLLDPNRRRAVVPRVDPPDGVVQGRLPGARVPSDCEVPRAFVSGLPQPLGELEQLARALALRGRHVVLRVEYLLHVLHPAPQGQRLDDHLHPHDPPGEVLLAARAHLPPELLRRKARGERGVDGHDVFVLLLHLLLPLPGAGEAEAR